MNNNNNNTDHISYSLFLENRKREDSSPDPLRYTLSKKSSCWQNDSDVLNCQNKKCNSLFTFFNRKHHCRKCGQIFCSTCSSYKVHIPEHMLSDDSRKGTMNDYLFSYVSNDNTHRVCKQCYNEMQQLNCVKRTIKVFEILSLDIIALSKAKNICKIWMHAANYRLSILKNIQYKLPYEEYLLSEKAILYNNLEYLSGHSRYLINYLKIIDGEQNLNRFKFLLSSKKKINCFKMMCASNCRDHIIASDMIDVIAYYFNYGGSDSKLKFILSCFDCSDEEFICYIPFLVYNICSVNNDILSNFLVNKCIDNFLLVNALYRELNVLINTKNDQRYILLKQNLITKISSLENCEYLSDLLKGDSLINTIKNLANIDIHKSKIYDLTDDIILPINTNISVNKIKLDSVVTKMSATRPTIFPLITDKNDIYNLMFKNENTRKDQIIMNIIRLIIMIVKREENINLDIVTYNILSTDLDEGIIEIVDECDTIYSIHQDHKTDILNYIMETNGEMTIKELRDRFIKSTAAFSVITYILGVGDRHLDNIMIARDGRLFHIDFGYILGKDTVISNPGIRITPDIIQAIGGENSRNYVIFKNLCSQIYNCIRRNINIFYHMLILLPDISDIELTKEAIKSQILMRFRPSEDRIDAELHLVNQLEQNNITDKIKDWCHYHSKEKTITGPVDQVSSIFSSFFSYSSK